MVSLVGVFGKAARIHANNTKTKSGAFIALLNTTKLDLPLYCKTLQCGTHLFLGDGEFQHGMNGKQFQQLADVGFLARLHDHDYLSPVAQLPAAFAG